MNRQDAFVYDMNQTRRGDSKNVPAETALKKRGRKPGKHSNENYTQTSIYLPIELRNLVRARLYERGMEMSGLVEEMLRGWINDKANRKTPVAGGNGKNGRAGDAQP